MNAAYRFRTVPSSRVGDLDEVPAEPVLSQPVAAVDPKRGTKQDTLKCLVFFLETCQMAILKIVYKSLRVLYYCYYMNSRLTWWEFMIRPGRTDVRV